MNASRRPSATATVDGRHPTRHRRHLRSPQRTVRAHAYLEQLIEQGHILACCPVNITEVYAGLRPGEETETEAFLDSLQCLPVTPAIAKQAGLLRRDWQKKGQTLSYTDVTIAAVALSNEVSITGSISPFRSCNSYPYRVTTKRRPIRSVKAAEISALMRVP